MSSGNLSHLCFDEFHIDATGAGKCGSPKQPTEIPVFPKYASVFHKTVVPHVGQNFIFPPRPESLRTSNDLNSPRVEITCSSLKYDETPTTDPVLLCHLMQLQAITGHLEN